jgi:hypothetical protein
MTYFTRSLFGHTTRDGGPARGKALFRPPEAAAGTVIPVFAESQACARAVYVNIVNQASYRYRGLPRKSVGRFTGSMNNRDVRHMATRDG